MKCPVCKTVDLQMTERQGVEIDYCPQCRGVWLDRGELDKIIERMAVVEQRPAAPPPPPQQPVQSPPPAYQAQPPRYRYDDDDDVHYDSYGRPVKKKKSMLGEMFDIFD